MSPKTPAGKRIPISRSAGNSSRTAHLTVAGPSGTNRSSSAPSALPGATTTHEFPPFAGPSNTQNQGPPTTSKNGGGVNRTNHGNFFIYHRPRGVVATRGEVPRSGMKRKMVVEESFKAARSVKKAKAVKGAGAVEVGWCLTSTLMNS